MAAPQLTSQDRTRDSRINSRARVVSKAVMRQVKLQVRAEQTANFKESPANLGDFLNAAASILYPRHSNNRRGLP
jgi:hypothetical protein